jgi:glycosyltransferase involved in cell wall biosynthesis
VRGSQSLRIVQLRVEDRAYPRNERIRRHLEESGHTVSVHERADSGPKPVRVLKDLVAIVRRTRQADVLVLAEFSLSFVPFVWLMARLRGIPLVVDGFVGKYETAIEDWKLASARSLTALWCRAFDRAGVRLADAYLIDTEARAEAIRVKYGRENLVFALPVGAPSWIHAAAPSARTGSCGLKALYFGGNIPLHGLPKALQGLQTASAEVTLQLVLSGPREAVDATIDDLGIGDRCTFLPPMPHRDLVERIQATDVCLGIFGDSPKARGVVANKVWQGLAAGRPVITRRTPATEELAAVAGDLLILVDDVPGLARALDTLNAATALPYDPDIDARLDAWVRFRFAALTDWLDDARRRRATR